MPFPDPLATCYIVYGSDVRTPFVIVLHMFQVGTFPTSNAEAGFLADMLDNTIGAQLIQCIPSDCRYEKVVVYINDGGVSYSAENNDTNAAGASGTQSLPDYSAVVIQKRTAVGGKSGRGRWYLGCVPEGNQDTGRIVPGALAAYQQLADDLKLDYATLGGTWRSGHMSRKDSTVVAISECRINIQLGTRRKRLLRQI